MEKFSKTSHYNPEMEENESLQSLKEIKKEFVNSKIRELTKERDEAVQAGKDWDPVQAEKLRDFRGLNGLDLNHPALLGYFRAQVPFIESQIQTLEKLTKIMDDPNDPRSVEIKSRFPGARPKERLDWLRKTRDFLGALENQKQEEEPEKESMVGGEKEQEEETKFNRLTTDIPQALSEYVGERLWLKNQRELPFREKQEKIYLFEHKLALLEIPFIESLIEEVGEDLSAPEDQSLTAIERYQELIERITKAKGGIYPRLFHTVQIEDQGQLLPTFYNNFTNFSYYLEQTKKPYLIVDENNGGAIQFLLVQDLPLIIPYPEVEKSQTMRNILGIMEKAKSEAAEILQNKHKIELFYPERGSRFDPLTCQALGIEKTKDLKPEAVARVARPGIKQHGKLKFKADVMVAK